MKSFLTLLATGLLVLGAANSYAQSRDLGAQRFILDDGNGTGRLTMEYAGPGDVTFIFPPFPSTTVPLGSLNGQTLAWDQANGEWDAMSNLLNDGTDLSMPTGNLSLGSGDVTAVNGNFTNVSGNGSAITNINASNIATGSLDLARISTAGAATNQAIVYDGANLVYNNPAAGSLVLPFSQTASNASALFTLTNTDATTGAAGNFFINNAANSGTALYAATNGNGGAAITGTLSGTGNAIVGLVDPAGIGSAGSFVNSNAANNANALFASTIGVGSAGRFEINNAANSSPAINAITNGAGGSAISGTMNGSGSAIIGQVSGIGNGTAATFMNSNTLNGNSTVVIADAGIGPAFTSENLGAGSAGEFIISNAANGDYVIHATTVGTGTVGQFELNNVGSGGSAIVANTNGLGHAATFRTTGGGSAASVIINNAANPNAALSVATDGTGISGNFQITNAANSAPVLAATTLGTGSAIELTAAAGGTAIQMNTGRFIGSTGTVASGGTISNDIMVVEVQDDGTGAAATANVPVSGFNGQIIIAATNDPDGLTIGTSSVGSTESIMLTFVGGSWHVR